MDKISKEKRSLNMSRIRSKDTAPEIRVRSYLHRAGLRFRLHVKNLHGSPDIVLPKYRTAIFVHGCYWHRHLGCKYTYTPKSRIGFWQKKFQQNVKRDQVNKQMLVEAGWRVLTVWECETKTTEKIAYVVKPLFKSQES